jgi:mevalonate kinase
MKWKIPAKTFLLGEYAAISGAPALILTTHPCFEISLVNRPSLHGIHPDSPAGRWWRKQNITGYGLDWHDPYNGKGGLGASSAQFVGAFYAVNHLQNKKLCRDEMLECYLQVAWDGKGVRPSGYDVIAQSLRGCVLVEQQKDCHCYVWPFDDLAFILLHTGQKLATHQHLQTLTLPAYLRQLACIVESAQKAFEQIDSQRLIIAVNAYYQALMDMNLVAEHSKSYIQTLQTNEHILASKGCGAMGADIVFVLVLKTNLNKLLEELKLLKRDIIATSEDLFVI